MAGEGTMDRWIALEMGRLQQAFVAAPRLVHELLQEDAPGAPTKSGETHRFDRAVLRRLHDALGPLDQRRLRLPATFYVDKDVEADAYVTDPTVVGLLRALGDVPEATLRDGKLWVGHARARAIAQRHPTAFQFVYH
jgi:uncharacterized protein (UPF0216 family)